MGGWIAFEMARQLKQQGEDISLLGVIDIEAPGRLWEPLSENREPDPVQALMALCGMLETYTGREIPVTREDLVVLDEDERAEYIFRKLSSHDLLPAEIDLKYFLRYLAIHESNLRASYHYTPETYDGKIVVFASTEELPNNHVPRREDPTLGWQNYSSMPIAWRRIPGNHLTMITAPNVRILARLLESDLEEKVSTQPMGAESMAAAITIG